eukprot:Filipodium_phascolosomae@DN2606_c0_g1_i1.p1
MDYPAWINFRLFLQLVLTAYILIVCCVVRESLVLYISLPALVAVWSPTLYALARQHLPSATTVWNPSRRHRNNSELDISETAFVEEPHIIGDSTERNDRGKSEEPQMQPPEKTDEASALLDHTSEDEGACGQENCLNDNSEEKECISDLEAALDDYFNIVVQQDIHEESDDLFIGLENAKYQRRRYFHENPPFTRFIRPPRGFIFVR